MEEICSHLRRKQTFTVYWNQIAELTETCRAHFLSRGTHNNENPASGAEVKSVIFSSFHYDDGTVKSESVTTPVCLLPLCSSAALPLCLSASLQLCSSAALPLCRSAALQLCSSAALPLCSSAALPLCSSAALPLCRPGGGSHQTCEPCVLSIPSRRDHRAPPCIQLAAFRRRRSRGSDPHLARGWVDICLHPYGQGHASRRCRRYLRERQ